MMMLPIVVSGKGKLWNEWKQGKISKKKYLETKKRLVELFTRQNVKQGKRFGKIWMQWDDQKCGVFKTAKSVVKTNQDIIDEHPIRNDDGVPAII